MEYKFNKDYFSQLCAERRLTNVALQDALKMTNTTPINRWRAGKDIRSDHIVRICNAFNVNPAEFFLCDGKPIAAPQKGEMTSTPDKNETPDASNELMKQQLERAEVEKQHMEEISNMKCEHIRELMQKDIDLAKKEVRLREEIRKEIKAEYENEITRLRTLLIELSAKREI